MAEQSDLRKNAEKREFLLFQFAELRRYLHDAIVRHNIPVTGHHSQIESPWSPQPQIKLPPAPPTPAPLQITAARPAAVRLIALSDEPTVLLPSTVAIDLVRNPAELQAHREKIACVQRNLDALQEQDALIARLKPLINIYYHAHNGEWPHIIKMSAFNKMILNGRLVHECLCFPEPIIPPIPVEAVEGLKEILCE